MRFDRDQMAALASVLRLGSFEGAAADLGITQPAVSQRIRALEEQVGLPLIRRATPCTGTEAGTRLARHAEEVALLERAVQSDLALDVRSGPTRVAIAVNADSLATWFAPVLAAVEGLLVDVQIDDQDHSAGWLARGEVSAAVTGTSRPVAGCDTVALGELRYVASASPAFLNRWFPDGVTTEALSRAPMLTFNAKDQLQARWLQAKTGRKLFPPSHMLASTDGFAAATRAGAGWAMNPETLIRDSLRDGSLVPLDPNLPMDVPHFWQISRRMKPPLALLDRAVRDAARSHLRRS